MQFTYSDPVWRKFQFNKILWIIGIWVLLSVFHSLSTWAILATYGALPPNFTFGGWLVSGILIGIVAGIPGALLTVLYFERWFRKLPFLRAFVQMTLVFAVYCFGILLVAFPLIHTRANNIAINEPTVWESFFAYLYTPDAIRNVAFWFFITILTTAGLVINDKYGPGVLRQVLLGKFYKPVKRKRIFMFLDLRNSTGLAEQLGEEKYFGLLKEIIEDVTTPILYTRGEIYQYVGDEIVISWNMRRGRAHSNCIRCYFKIQEVLRRKKPIYLAKYGVEPQFKAGLHAGMVLAGEIGVVKRDITYTGDVLNTASRIQNKCNDLGVDLLISKALLDMLNLAPHEYNPQRIGSIDLRGKSEQMVLFTL